jgi:hypothetical protein
MTGMSECEKYREMVGAYVDGLLRGSSEREFLSHVEGCPSCRAELEAEKAVLEELGSLELLDPGREFTDLVMERIFGTEPLPARTGVLGRIVEAFRRSGYRIPRVAWASLIAVSLVAYFLLPSLIESGVVSLLSGGTGVLFFLTNPLAGLFTSLHQIGSVAAPLAKALLLALKVSVEFILTLIGTEQFSFILLASVLVVMTVSICTAFHLTMARRRIRHAEIHL